MQAWPIGCREESTERPRIRRISQVTTWPVATSSRATGTSSGGSTGPMRERKKANGAYTTTTSCRTAAANSSLQLLDSSQECLFVALLCQANVSLESRHLLGNSLFHSLLHVVHLRAGGRGSFHHRTVLMQMPFARRAHVCRGGLEAVRTAHRRVSARERLSTSRKAPTSGASVTTWPVGTPSLKGRMGCGGVSTTLVRVTSRNSWCGVKTYRKSLNRRK